jgi:hypothetical protein
VTVLLRYQQPKRYKNCKKAHADRTRGFFVLVRNKLKK